MRARPRRRSAIPCTSLSGLALLAGVVLAGASVANATEPGALATPKPAPMAPAHSPRERWYGYQTLLADGGALAIAIAGVATNDRSTGQGVLVAAAAAYALGGPIVHLAHSRGQASLASLGLRAGGPLVGGLLGVGLAALAPYDDGDEYVVGGALGVLAGVAGAVALDAILVAREPVDEVASSSTSGWQPALSLSDERIELGLVNVF